MDPQLTYDCTKIVETLQVTCGANNLLKSLLYMQASLSLNICKLEERKQMLEASELSNKILQFTIVGDIVNTTHF